MAMRPAHLKSFHRVLFAGWNETVTLLKRNDDQQQGTVRTLTLFQCRRGKILKTGQTIQGDMVSDHRTTWHIAAKELERVGVSYLNNLDRIVDSKGRYWQPESPIDIEVKLGEVHTDVACLRVDPPS